MKHSMISSERSSTVSAASDSAQKGQPDQEPFLALAAPESQLALARFRAVVADLLSVVEDLARADGLRLEFDDQMWRTDVAPPWGTARYSGAMDSRLVRRMIIGADERFPLAAPEYAGQLRVTGSGIGQRPRRRRPR